MAAEHPERPSESQTLSDFGADATPELRQPEYDEGNERGCPQCSLRLADLQEGERGDAVDVPVDAFAMPGISTHLAEEGIESVRSHGWVCENHDRDIVMPDVVSNHEALGYSDEMVGIRVEHSDGESYFIPVRITDLSDALATAVREVLQP